MSWWVFDTTKPQRLHRQYSATPIPTASNRFSRKKLIGDWQMVHFIILSLNNARIPPSRQRSNAIESARNCFSGAGLYAGNGGCLRHVLGRFADFPIDAAGLPNTLSPGLTSRTTTLPAPTKAQAPTLTSGMMQAWLPRKTPFSSLALPLTPQWLLIWHQSPITVSCAALLKAPIETWLPTVASQVIEANGPSTIPLPSCTFLPMLALGWMRLMKTPPRSAIRV